MFNNLLTMAYYLDSLYARVNKNPDPCQSVACKRRKKKKFVIPVVASSTAAVLLLLFIFSGLAIYKQKRHEGISFL